MNRSGVTHHREYHFVVRVEPLVVLPAFLLVPVVLVKELDHSRILEALAHAQQEL